MALSRNNLRPRVMSLSSREDFSPLLPNPCRRGQSGARRPASSRPEVSRPARGRRAEPLARGGLAQFWFSFDLGV